MVSEAGNYTMLPEFCTGSMEIAKKEKEMDECCSYEGIHHEDAGQKMNRFHWLIGAASKSGLHAQYLHFYISLLFGVVQRFIISIGQPYFLGHIEFFLRESLAEEETKKFSLQEFYIGPCRVKSAILTHPSSKVRLARNDYCCPQPKI